MKIEYVNGIGVGMMRTIFGEVEVRGIRIRWSFVCGSCIEDTNMFTKKAFEKIIIVKQKNKLLTMFILFHEVLHYITIKAFGRESRIHDWIDKYI